MTLRTISLKLTKPIHEQLLKQVINDNYGMRGKSRWVKESLESFLVLEYFPDLVDLADNMENLTEVVSFRFPEELCKRTELAVIDVRKKYPGLEGVKSKIIRASIMQRLLGNFPAREIV